MGRKLSGRSAFFVVVACLAGVTGGLWLLWANFCLWVCTIQQSAAFDFGLGLTIVSVAALLVFLALAVAAVRRRDGRPWAVAALCLAGAPVVFGLVAVPLAYFALGF